jgi:hypothetical protein
MRKARDNIPPICQFRHRNLTAIKHVDCRICSVFGQCSAEILVRISMAEGTMPGRISSSIGPIAVVAAVVVSQAGVGLRTNSAYANDCVVAPNASAPQGQHWYYRIDRPHQHKCWYLHATMPLLHRAAIKHAERHGMSTSAGAAMPQSIEDSAPGSANATTIAAKPQLVPFIRTMAEEESQQSAPEETDTPSIPRESGVRALTDAPTVISDDPGDAAAGEGSTETAGMAGALRLIFFLVGSGLAVAGLLVHIMIKTFGQPRIQIPETARIGQQLFDERSGRQAHDDRRDDRRRFGFADARSREHFAARQQEIVSARRSAPGPQNMAAAAAKTPRHDAKDIERALRVIKQARQRQDA